ncbi:MAG TPA: tyrosine--tRNA ligase [Thermomicrobiales bacterium]|jgi:tyrosyl-tRNA synthetase|nr:tyrosine--tRNA ligase [Thermomicrobiales bacterium]
MTEVADAEHTIPRTPSGRLSAPDLAIAQGVNPIDYLRSRGFVHDIVDEDGLKAELEKGPITYYIGFDPTGPSLHAGHMATIMLLASLQRFGHRPIALAGGGTAMVGDPTGRTSAREMIQMDELDRNVAGISKQLAKYLDFEGGQFGDNAPAKLLNNADWLLKLEYIPFLRDIGQHFSVNEMLASETYRVRYESGGLNFVEFNYRLVQSYDFLHLYRTENCILQMGGSDQWSNILGGVDLIRRADGGKAYALVQPLITTTTGEKMGKTGTGLRVWLDPEMFSPYDYYQYWVNTEDELVETYLKRFTYISNDEIAELTSVQGEALREAKRVLAFEATAMAHGIEEAEKAERATKALFSGARGQVSADDDTLPTTEIPRADVEGEMTLADAFVRAELAKGRGEARRLAQQGGLSVNDEKVADVDVPFAGIMGDQAAILLRAGKKRFKRVVVV